MLNKIICIVFVFVFVYSKKSLERSSTELITLDSSGTVDRMMSGQMIVFVNISHLLKYDFHTPTSLLSIIMFLNRLIVSVLTQ